MGLIERAFNLLGDLLLERPAQGKTLADFRREIESAGRDALQRLAVVDDTVENVEALRHIIGIERWGQRRLRVALGEPLIMDESDRYYPPTETSWDQLRQEFRQVRRETVALAHKLEEAEVCRDVKVPHNQWGALTVYGWLNYLNGHANRDVKGIN
jgi:hypothetical protein